MNRWELFNLDELQDLMDGDNRYNTNILIELDEEIDKRIFGDPNETVYAGPPGYRDAEGRWVSPQGAPLPERNKD